MHALKIFLLGFCLVFSCAIPEAKAQDSNSTAKAVFAGGCFWCMQPPFDKLKDKGVLSSRSGYIGGHKKNPTYKEVSKGGTGHLEAVEIVYDPKKISYPELLNVFWVNIDPFNDQGQFCDSGEPYLSAIFALNETQKKEAEKSLEEIKAKFKDKQIATTIRGPADFYPAEEYHQDYYLKNPIRYKFYRHGCGRDKRLNEVWGKK